MGDDFYRNMKGFAQFSELSNPSHYEAVPSDWYVVVTDVKNSTVAIEHGKYKEINLSGAAVIMSILNVSGDTQIPYAFGGDGATMLIPAALVDKALMALASVQAKVKSAFELELRAGCVPMKALYEAKATLMVAKFWLSPDAAQAVFQGTALALAEGWLKKGNSAVIVAPANEGEPDLHGLECRWQPLQNRNGKILSLLVKVTPAYEAQGWQLYADILKEIATIYPENNVSLAQSMPVVQAGMNLSFSPKNLYREALLRRPAGSVSQLLYLLRILIINSIGYLSFRSKKPVVGFDGQKYLRELVANSDVRKFDEMLRMVLDSTPEQHTALEAMLCQWHQQSKITYGIHESSQALMTCLVFSLSGDHVHLVDGADGGYALAAKQMKQQMKAGA